MPRSTLLLGSCLLIGSMTLAWYWQRPSAEKPAIAQPEQRLAPAAAQAEAPPAPSGPSREQLQLLASAEVAQQERRLDFHRRYREFIEHAKALDSNNRYVQAAELSDGVDALERRGELALSEALLLQIALIKAVSVDENEQKRRAEELIKRYQTLSAEREAKLAQRPDPNFEHYKVEEKRIVEEVLALQNIPDGLTRDQYLRQRLQEARERSYRQPPGS
ncbi:hypothetical protein EQ836_04710 [Ectopseudomonas mendocina]|uniref:Lipase modulator n=1 Tax=Ectopseudomonas mendocina TaxID=300 RepID=A0ABD7RZR8_ECTME|nr:hypothetical protein [Pseudomonas mendocina]TRO16208.1 hypothetical protein EQ829_05300 [Pseudomonas mendocina]TRO20193.1 hypothetical protein EQ836_04710 [Pseudomonas mendocina]